MFKNTITCSDSIGQNFSFNVQLGKPLTLSINYRKNITQTICKQANNQKKWLCHCLFTFHAVFALVQWAAVKLKCMKVK